MTPDDAGRRVSDALEAVGAGDAHAMRRLHMATAGKLHAVCLRILGDRAEAEEVVQDVYLAVWRRPSAFDPARGAALPWLIAVARNRAIDRVRGRRPDRPESIETGAAAEVADPGPDASAQLLADEDTLRLHACLDALDAPTALAIRGAFQEGITHESLAASAGVPLGTMKSRIRRGLLKMRGTLER